MAEAAAVSFASPILITVLSVPVLAEVVGLRRWMAVAAGLLGVLVVVRPGTAAFQPAALFALASSVCWSTASVLTRKMAAGERATTTLLWSAVSGFVVLSAMLPGQAIWPAPAHLALAVVLGVVASSGQYLLVLAYRYAAASLLAPFSYLQLIWATVLGWLVFGALPDGMTLLGAAIIVASGLYTAGRERRRSAAKALSRPDGYRPPARQ
jgi:drug/metabolite transporter (DMT)-like permease